MSPPLRSREATLSLMAAEFGVSWPNKWWPGGKSAFADCAACVSWALWGLNHVNGPRHTLVSQIRIEFQNDGLWHPGNQGILRGDVLTFEWGNGGSADHVEIATGPAFHGRVTSRGTNSSGDDMRDRTRGLGTVVGFGRPSYPGLDAPEDEGVKMPAIKVIRQDANGDAGKGDGAEYGSMAIVFEEAGYSRRLSTRLGSRGAYDALVLISGMLGLNIDKDNVVPVDRAGWDLTLGQFPFRDEDGPSAEEIAAAIQSRMAGEEAVFFNTITALKNGTSDDITPVLDRLNELPHDIVLQLKAAL